MTSSAWPTCVNDKKQSLINGIPAADGEKTSLPINCKLSLMKRAGKMILPGPFKINDSA
jgi:hypothetical protein